MENKRSQSLSKKGKLYYSFPAISMIPLLLYGVIVIIFSNITFSHSMQKQVSAELENVANLVDTLLDTAYPGDYTLTGEESFSLYKGDTDITGDYRLVDTIKERTGMEVTLFYQDTRILTTIRNWEGQRLVGTRAPEIVVQDVLEQGESHFYTNTIINGSIYFAYYTPLYNSGGQIAGILFVGKPAAAVNNQISQALSPIVIVGLLTMLFACLFSVRYARTILKALYDLKAFFAKVATGSLNEKLDPSVLKRKDELTDIGLSAMTMQHSLRNLVELDTLTQLYNRRSGEFHLNSTLTKAREKHIPFTLVIGDIDFFKRVNDTYGHQCGDVVLKNVSNIIRKHIKGKGYAIRWGGEEFLLVYEGNTLEKAHSLLNALLEEVRGTCNHFADYEVYVTMTFGMVCDPSMELNDLLRDADAKLYYGKNTGRNRIISDLSQPAGD